GVLPGQVGQAWMALPNMGGQFHTQTPIGEDLHRRVQLCRRYRTARGDQTHPSTLPQPWRPGQRRYPVWWPAPVTCRFSTVAHLGGGITHTSSSNSTRLPPAAPVAARFRRLRTEGRRPAPVHRTATPPAAHARPPRATDSCSRAPPVATVGRTHSRQYPNA